METTILEIIEPITNMQKHDNYVEQFKRLKKAIANGFNLEAIFIVYTIIEDRTESVLRHGGYWDAYVKSRRGHILTIESKIKYIQKQAENKSNPLHKYFSDDLLDRILIWKEKRNRLIHALLKQSLTDEEVSHIAAEGDELMKTLRTRTENYKRALNKLIL